MTAVYPLRISANPLVRSGLNTLLFVALLLCLATTAQAAGSSMPWEGPLPVHPRLHPGAGGPHRGGDRDCRHRVGAGLW